MIRKLFKRYGEIIRYLIVGVLTTVVSLSTYFVCVHFFLNPEFAIELQIANIISWVVAVTFAYVTNRIFVFKSNNNDVAKEIFLFFVARISSLVIDMGIMFLGVTILGVDDIFTKLIDQIIVIIANYLLSKLIVFKR